MKNEIINVKNKLVDVKNKAVNYKDRIVTAYIMAIAAMQCGTITAYADSSDIESSVKTMVTDTVSNVFVIMSVIIAGLGLLSLVPGIVVFVKSLNSEGADKNSGANQIAIGIGLMLVAILVFLLKDSLVSFFDSVSVS